MENKIRQLWLPFLILALVILAISWIVANIVYPSNVQGNDLDLAILEQYTPTVSPTVTSTHTSTPVSTKPVSPSTATSTAENICTYTMHFWSANPDSWMIENIVIGNLSFNKTEAIEILEIENPDPTTRMLQKYFAALLNTLNGADSSDIGLTMVKVGDWLIIHPPGDILTPAESAQVELLTRKLEDYNGGLTGPGHCLNEPMTPTPAATHTQTATSTSTTAPINTARPRTPTPTKGSGSKPKPPKPPATSPPPAPTNPPQPPPTNPPRPTPSPKP